MDPTSAASLDALVNEESILNAAASSPDGSGQALYPSPEGASLVMDTTFYYALYMVLFIGTLVGNFFLVSHMVHLAIHIALSFRNGKCNRETLDFVKS